LVQLREEVLSGGEEQLHSGSADLALCSIGIAGYVPQKLGTLQFLAVAHPQDPRHQLRRTLRDHDVVGRLQDATRASGRSQHRDEGWLGAEQRWTVPSLSTAAKLVSRGLGFAWLPRHDIAAQLEQGTLAVLPLAQGSERAAPIYLYARKDRPLGPAARILADLIISHSQSD